MQIKIESILHGSAVDLRYQPARLRKRCAVEAYPFSYRQELVRSLPRMPAAPAADVNPKLPLQGREPALESADDAGGDAGGMPIHPHYGSERLEPEGMGEAAQELVAAVVMNDGFARDRAKARHAVREPSRHVATVQRQVGASRPASHQQSFLCSVLGFYHDDALVREKGALRTSMSNSAARPLRESRHPVRLREHRHGTSGTDMARRGAGAEHWALAIRVLQ
jgi:hypothetical protein